MTVERDQEEEDGERRRHGETQTGEIIIGRGSGEIRMKCEIGFWLGWKWDDTNETERKSADVPLADNTEGATHIPS